jgi:hypothetical protein
VHPNDGSLLFIACGLALAIAAPWLARMPVEISGWGWHYHRFYPTHLGRRVQFAALELAAPFIVVFAALFMLEPSSPAHEIASDALLALFCAGVALGLFDLVAILFVGKLYEAERSGEDECS